MKKFVIIFMSVLMIFYLMGCNADTGVDETFDNTGDVESASKEIYSDEVLTVSFVKKNDSMLQGMFEFYLNVENKTDQQVTVYLQDAYMNDVMFMVGSGVPCDILPEKSRTHGFTGKYEGTSIASADEIVKLGFSVRVVNENFETLVTTDNIEVVFE